MTRQYTQQFHCPNCKTWHSSETLFGRWIRNCKDLDSRLGFSVSDQDYWIHRYKTHTDSIGTREFQLLMLVEIKTFGAELSDAQTDTLHMANQLMRNRTQTPTKDLKWQAGQAPQAVYSAMLKRNVEMRAYGMHVLTFSHLGPDDSEWMRWNRTPIDEQQLIGLLRFDLDPDTLGPLDLRRHHAAPHRSLALFGGGDG